MAGLTSGGGRGLRPGGAPLQVVGHRGAAGHAPENTLASFTQALALGADLVELDVQLSKDGRLVVIHDHRVDRTTNGRGLVADMTLAELQALDAGSWFDPRYAGERVPSLDEVFDWAKGRTRLVIEIKNAPVYYPALADRLVATLEARGMVDAAIVISFDHPSVRRVKELLPGSTTGLLYVARPIDPIALALGAQADLLMPHWSQVQPEDVAKIQAAGLALSVWTVNERKEMEHALQLGVDAAGTDYPDRLRQVVPG